MSAPRETAIELALEIGFDLVGIAPLGPPRGAARFEQWLAAGSAGEMEWLGRDRQRILEPSSLLEGRRGRLLCLGLGHSRGQIALAGGGRVARYAAGRDYHNVIGRKLRRLARALVERGLVSDWRKVVDAGPLLERSHAAEAGLGFESKAANLLHPGFGPWFFLGELALDVDWEPSRAAAGSCGSCTACIDACPTQAIEQPGWVDARRCISYLTIESSAPIPEELRDALGGWAFGCDICSEVCPWGQRAPDLGERFGLHPAIESGSLADWLALSEADFAQRFNGSPLLRAGRAGLARNAAIALGNLPASDEARRALLAALRTDPSPVVRESAAWALRRAFGLDAEVRRALEQART